MGLRRLITEFLWPPSSSIIRPWLPYSIKVLVKKNQTSPNSMGLRRLITEFLWPLPAPSSDPGYHIVSKYSSRKSNEPKLDGVFFEEVPQRRNSKGMSHQMQGEGGLRMRSNADTINAT
ncbi:hypothetical protein EVAR_97356_1 [Eumeta japonica]|uniref:Uncharacterized protein n=1 Tax=Eumeta variegata TaxID=151549 RepID=A0A4C1YYY8_EUMVA|nr:hypothetical protein EVAR_97356_1 [Eumeta japonica]